MKMIRKHKSGYQKLHEKKEREAKRAVLSHSVKTFFTTGCEWFSSHSCGRRFRPQNVSRPITWQDGRCTTSFLSSLPKPESHLNVSTGFGCASILWYTRHIPFSLCSPEFTASGTIQDYVVSMLCGLEVCLMSIFILYTILYSLFSIFCTTHITHFFHYNCAL
ncbi:hypothetical protein Q7C36_022558 [Tachysurus vachellii]|uniref:Uncharacterized protein n=1 Tax=Tachysurus vachellii TaxID=175792 RepID=A0AA88LNX2_TACVA|nr:hypothetical protein Q7C36_022558 [Tachysurus vachellii]